MKDKFVNEFNWFKTYMLRERNKQKVMKKWKDECMIEMFYYDDVGLGMPPGSLKHMTKEYYKNIKIFLRQMPIDKLKEKFKKELVALTKKIKQIINSGSFSYKDDDDIVIDFCYYVLVACKLKIFEPSRTFGIIRADKRPLKFTTIY